MLEDNLWWKMNYGGRKPSVEDDLHCILACCLHRFTAFFNEGIDDPYGLCKFSLVRCIYYLRNVKFGVRGVVWYDRFGCLVLVSLAK